MDFCSLSLCTMYYGVRASASGELAEIKSQIQGFKLSAQSVGQTFFIVFLNNLFILWQEQIWLKIRFKI